MPVSCRECGEEFRQIQWAHLKKHNMTLGDYKKKYPNASITSEETRQKISENHANVSGENNPQYGMKRPKSSKRMKEDNPMQDPEVRKKVKETQFNKGNKPWNKGKTKKDDERILEYSGENHYKFKNWASKEPYDKNWSDELRGKVRERDNYECQFCGMTQEIHKVLFRRLLTVHHVNGHKKESKMGNLITLCKYCHQRWHSWSISND